MGHATVHRLGGIMQKVTLVGMALWALTASSPARADCVRAFTNAFRCVPEQCVFVMETSVTLPPALRHQGTGTLVPLDVLTLADGRSMFGAPQVLLTGDHDLLDANQQPVFFSVTVEPAPPGFSGVHASANYQAQPSCRDTSPSPPPSLIPTTLVFSVELGRAPLPDTRADIWFLRPGDAVPPGPPQVFSLASPAADVERIADMPTITDQAFKVIIPNGLPDDADRVAIQVMETTGERTGVLVVALKDVPGWHPGCSCTAAPHIPSHTCAGALGVFAWFARRGRRTSETPSTGEQ